MKNHRVSGKRILHLLCLLIMVGILCMGSPISADATNTGNTGTTTHPTTILDPGEAETPEELANLNVSDDLSITINNGNGSIAGSLKILLILTGIALAPTLIICLTSYTRILIVLHFTRAALNTQTAPPNQVLVGLALFLTFFIMSPTVKTIYDDAFVPLDKGEIEWEEALDTAMDPLRDFMYGQTQTKDVSMFMQIGGYTWDGTAEAVPTAVLIPSFMVSELRTAFIIGFLIYIPFIVIDMVVASTLMSMGMMMLPPTTISMPFKILLFILADGWNLVIMNVVRTFY